MSTGNPGRDPGEAIKRLLRNEVNFGCPVSGCGSPILTYHHFDPPWAGNFEHNPAGMIALCKPHHDQADGGLWTKAQLRDMKRNPYVNSAVRIRWPYATECLVLKVGPCFVVHSGSALRLNCRHVMRFRPETIEQLSAKTVVFDSEIADVNDDVWLRIVDNWLDLDIAEASDVVFPPHAKQFMAKRKDQSKIKLQFRTFSLSELEPWLRTKVSPNQKAIDEGRFKPRLAEEFANAIIASGAIDSDGRIPVMEVSGQFVTPEVKVIIRSNRLTVDFAASLSGRPEKVDFRSHMVDSEHRISVRYDPSREGGREFFGIG
jgi:hypothetical protein